MGDYVQLSDHAQHGVADLLDTLATANTNSFTKWNAISSEKDIFQRNGGRVRNLGWNAGVIMCHGLCKG